MWTLCLLLSANLFTLELSETLETPFLADSSNSYYWSPQNCCGLIATYIVQTNLGVPVSLDELATQISISAHGTSMLEIVDHVNSVNLSATGVDVSSHNLSSELKFHETWTIALVNMGLDDHWVAARLIDSKTIAFYDHPSWHLSDLSNFAAIFKNKAIIISSLKGDSIDFRLLGYELYIVPVFFLILCVAGLVRVEISKQCFLDNRFRQKRVYSSLIILTLCGLFLGCEDGKQSIIQINPSVMDLGVLDISEAANQLVSREFEIKNLTNKKVTVSKLVPSCSCLLPEIEIPFIIMPQESRLIPLTVAISNGLQEGKFMRAVQIEVSDTESNMAQEFLLIEAEVKAPKRIVADPAQFDLGRVASWETRPIAFDISDADRPLDASSINIAGIGRLREVKQINTNVARCIVEINGAGVPGKFVDDIIFEASCGTVSVPISGTRTGPGPVSKDLVLVWNAIGDIKQVRVNYLGDAPEGAHIVSNNVEADVLEMEYPKNGTVQIDIALKSMKRERGKFDLFLTNVKEPVSFEAFLYSVN